MTVVPLLIHIGYHKTATTWLQRQLFVPEYGYRPILDHQSVFDYIVRPHGLTFDSNAARKTIKDALAKVRSGESGVISSEILSGHPFFGGRESDILAKRLADITPEARILISVRDQMRILPSVYMQYLLRGGTMDYVQFFKGEADIQYFVFSPEHFKYHQLVRLYQELFGKDKVFVLTQESLRNDLDETVKKLAEFSGNRIYSELEPKSRESVGESYPEYAAPILRRINHVQTSTLNPQPIISLGRTPKGFYKLSGYAFKNWPLSKILRNKKPVSNHVRQKFSSYFAESNQALSDLVGPELDLTGYQGIGQEKPSDYPK